MIERDFGVILKPGPALSEVGEKFWEKRKSRRLRQKNPQGPIILNKDYDDAGQIVLGNTPYNSSITYFGIRVLVKPSIFSKLVPHDNKNVDYIVEWLLAGKPIGAPFLKILIPYENWNNREFEPAKILGHEGRTRMRAIRRTFGDIPVETHLIIKTENRFIEGREALVNGPLSYNIYLNLLNREIWDENGFFLVKGPWFTIK